MMSSINFSFTLDDQRIINEGIGSVLSDIRMAPDGKLGLKVGYSDVEYIGMWERVSDD